MTAPQDVNTVDLSKLTFIDGKIFYDGVVNPSFKCDYYNVYYDTKYEKLSIRVNVDDKLAQLMMKVDSFVDTPKGYRMSRIIKEHGENHYINPKLSKDVKLFDSDKNPLEKINDWKYKKVRMVFMFSKIRTFNKYIGINCYIQQLQIADAERTRPDFSIICFD